MKKLFSLYVLSLCLFLTCACDLCSSEKITTYSGSLSSLDGDADDLMLIQHFPKAYYQQCGVQGVGKFYVDARTDIIKNKLRRGEVWEQEIVDLIDQYVTEGSTAVDIGSHIGTHTVSMSKKVGPNGQVVAFEPQKKIYAELVMNMELNECKNTRCYRSAVGSYYGEIEMNPPVIDNEGGTGIGAGGDRAKIIPLDMLGLKNVSLMKIDVENKELDVLKGARRTIMENHPVMIIEIMGNTYKPIGNREERVKEVLQYIEEMGYQLSYIQGSWSDWLAIPVQR